MSRQRALRLYAGPRARARLRAGALDAASVRVIAGAAGGPKGLILSGLDRFLFGHWLRGPGPTIDLAGASIGAWRMATAALPDPLAGFERLAHEYIHQDYAIEPGRKRPSAAEVSRVFGAALHDFFAAHTDAVLGHPRLKLHVVTSRGRHLLNRESRWRTPLGYAGAALGNVLSRRALGVWLERVVFSVPGAVPPADLHDLRHRHVALNAGNLQPALLASCSIPFVLRAVHDIPGAPLGAYWDGGITDYHLHWRWQPPGDGLVLYPHFQRAVVPGWLDKPLRRRHRPTAALDSVLVLAPDPGWVARLPGGKLPDRSDFVRFGAGPEGLAARAAAWGQAVAASAQLADEFAEWLERPGTIPVEPLEG